MIYSVVVPPDKERIEKYFDRDKDDLFVIAEYLKNSEYLFSYADNSTLVNDKMRVGYGPYVNDIINDETVLESLKRLLCKEDYAVNGKRYDTVCFEIWSHSDKECGIALSVNKENEPFIDALAELKPLNENGWYYYLSDYE